eukprot:CAMPEP_0204529988 /NCGR_PEP_ID=MMETSP0661-20131031/10366_1 /ASSEMBLY_ACC=CAM_ASM_000606 /TAXON_ID=109239 /ORGANISM="Alexandrium margalefi, Strain AMGDE01CS-322" /LENGTH=1076 /DNA_ID=CAMNT_0051536043 /DNA_START=60 /DNA_END=3290 /DNA_ORIENTATION=-
MATVFPSDQAIVVGGGLAGMSAANTVLESGGKVVLLDKSSFCGGNSTKATSGINGAATKTQKAKGIEDSIELFTSDTLKGGAKKPDVVKVLCGNSGADVDWLVERFNLDLSLVARLGGHSAPRTHRGKERFPGMTITYALIQMVEKVSERTDRAKIVTKARVTQLLTNEAGACVGTVYEKGGVSMQEHGPVILATGGFGADFTQQSLLAQYRPDLMHLPTTNGEHCTGDGIKMGEAIGGASIDLEWVQVHPTGLVKPDDPDAKIKFLAAEALRGVGGLVINASGERFANELGRRDYVTGEMWKNKPPFRLALNKKASDEIAWHCKHYTGRGVMKFYESGEALAKEMGIPVSTLEATHEAHYQAYLKTEKDPDGGSWPAYPSGKSWDEPSGKTGAGKKFFHNVIPGSAVKTEPFYVAIITPVIHYCMGGLEIDVDSAVLSSKTGKAIPGLYAAGEVAGGVHGNNRLGGNSLLDCVVFGRVAGKACAKYMLGDALKETSLAELSGGGLTGAVEASKNAGGSYEDNMNSATAAAGAASAAAPVAKKEKKEKKAASSGGYTKEEVAKHTTKGDCWVILHDRVLNVSSFLSQHPGGELAILTFAGKDATAEFDMIHPPDVVSKYAPDAVIGELGGGGGEEEEESEEEEETAAALPPGMAGYSKEEVAKHTTKGDCWVILHEKVLNVTSFLSQHPGGELAILTFAGKDATAEFDMIHPPDVVSKYAPDAIIGMVGAAGGGAPKKAKATGKGKSGGGAAAAPSKTKDAGSTIANHQAWGHLDGTENWRLAAADSNPGVFLINVKAYLFAGWALLLSVLYETCATIFTATNIKITNDRVGLTRSAIFLIIFIIIHAVGNLHVFKGPDDFNGYGYFYVRLYWTGFGLPANVVEEYVLLSIILHVIVGLKRTWDMKIKMVASSGLSVLNLAITGLMLMTFMTIHLFQFRFGDTAQFGPYYIRPPPCLVNFWGLLTLDLFWTEDATVPKVGVRDIYALEFQIFKNPIWSFFYVFSVLIFMTHAVLGWQKVTPVLVPKRYVSKAALMGYCIIIVIGLVYLSFPLYVTLAPAFAGYEQKLQVPANRIGA